MKKILYHGSEFLIEKPEFGKGARHNDYGRGFYCTENIELASSSISKVFNDYIHNNQRYSLNLYKVKYKYCCNSLHRELMRGLL